MLIIRNRFAENGRTRRANKTVLRKNAVSKPDEQGRINESWKEKERRLRRNEVKTIYKTSYRQSVKRGYQRGRLC